MNIVAISICIQCVDILCRHIFSILSGIYQRVESLGHRVTQCLTVSRNIRLFQGSHSTVCSLKQCMRVPISQHPHQHLLLSCIFIIVILMDIKRYHTVVLMFISLMINIFLCTFKHVFIHLLTNVYLLWRAYSDPLSTFLIGLFVFLLLSCKSSLYILDPSLLSDNL